MRGRVSDCDAKGPSSISRSEFFRTLPKHFFHAISRKYFKLKDMPKQYVKKSCNLSRTRSLYSKKKKKIKHVFI